MIDPSTKPEPTDTELREDAVEAPETAGAPLNREMESEKSTLNPSEEYDNEMPPPCKAALGHEPGCRPCCTAPHGKSAKLVCLWATLAWTLSFISLNNCKFLTANYLYCQEEQSAYPHQRTQSTTDEPHCTFITSDLGLGGYAGAEGNNWLGLPQGFLANASTQQDYHSLFGTCFRYQFGTALSGFWVDQKEIFGGEWSSAQSFAIVAVVLGFVCKVVTMFSLCCAYGPKVWKTMGGLFALCGLCMFLTLLFFASDVCELGCRMGEASILAIVAGLLWELTAYYAFASAPLDESIPKATCCCFPVPIKPTGPGSYSAVPTSEEQVTDIVVVEREQADGSKVVEKTVTYPNGSKSVKRTTIYQHSA